MLYENTEFFRAIDGEIVRIPSSAAPKRLRHTLTMASLKSLAISPFSFPFNNMLRIREALKLQTLPYAAAGDMELFPSILEKASRSSSGIAWFVPGGELENVKAPLANVDNRIWPAPLSLVSQVQGEGLTLWVDETSVCSILWRAGVPVLYRWKSTAKTTPAAERNWFEGYCRSKSEELGGFFMMDATVLSEIAHLPELIRESLARYPWLADVNLSRRALDNVLVLERVVRSCSRVAGWLLLFGLLVAGGNGLRYYEARQNIDGLRDRSSDLYRQAFDPSRTGRIPDPLGLARSKMAELRGGRAEGKLINEVLVDLGTIFEQNPSMDVTLDSVRYNSDGVDYTGSAPNSETALSFQKALGQKATSAQLGNLQRVPGGGFRFDLNVRW